MVVSLAASISSFDIASWDILSSSHFWAFSAPSIYQIIMGLLSKLKGSPPLPPLSDTNGTERSSPPKNRKEDIHDYPFMTGRVLAMGILVSMGGLIFGRTTLSTLVNFVFVRRLLIQM